MVFLKRANVPSGEQCAKITDVFESFQALDVFHGALDRGFIDRPARAVNELRSHLLGRKRRLRTSFGVFDVPGKNLSVLKTNLHFAGPAFRAVVGGG
jgi:hypothetical protein